MQVKKRGFSRLDQTSQLECALVDWTSPVDWNNIQSTGLDQWTGIISSRPKFKIQILIAMSLGIGSKDRLLKARDEASF